MRKMAVGLKMLLLIPLGGCAPASSPETPVVSELLPGQDRQDSLLPGEASNLQMAVKARTFYAVWLDAQGGSNVSVDVSGEPLAAPVSVRTNLLSSLSSQPQGTFYAQGDGEIQIEISNNAQPPAQNAGLVNLILFGSGSSTDTTLRIDELGTDDHGETPAEATVLVPDGRRTDGLLVYGDTYDYFLLPANAGDLFNVKVEATRELALATANIDSFGQFNFDVATNSGNRLSMSASPGTPATGQFSTVAAEPDGQVLFAVKYASGLFTPSLTFADYPIQYAITVDLVTSRQLQSGDTVSGRLDPNVTAEYSVDVPSVLSQLRASLSGPDGLILYVKKGKRASFEDFDFHLVLGGGTATDKLTIGPPWVRHDRYYLTVGSILGQSASYILSVEVE